MKYWIFYANLYSMPHLLPTTLYRAIHIIFSPVRWRGHLISLLRQLLWFFRTGFLHLVLSFAMRLTLTSFCFSCQCLRGRLVEWWAVSWLSSSMFLQFERGYEEAQDFVCWCFTVSSRSTTEGFSSGLWYLNGNGWFFVFWCFYWSLWNAWFTFSSSRFVRARVVLLLSKMGLTRFSCSFILCLLLISGETCVILLKEFLLTVFSWCPHYHPSEISFIGRFPSFALPVKGSCNS